MCGKLLGDGCITKQDGRKARFQFMHHLEDLGWVEHCNIQLKDYIPLNSTSYKRVVDTRLSKGYSESFFVQSKTDPLITDYTNNGIRKEKRNSWWYQDEGHLKIVNNVVQKIFLSTDSFSDEENDWLIQLLFDKFKLRFHKDGQNRLILYDQFQIIYFLHLVAP